MGISHVRVSFTKALGILAQGKTGGLAPSNWVKQEDQINADTEFQMDSTKWFAQRFSTTISAGRILFAINMRLPAGVGIPGGATLDVSLFNDTNSGPSGISLSGAFLPEQIVQSLANLFFHRPQPGKSDPSIQGGFISFPLTQVAENGTDSVNGGTTVTHFFEFPAQPGQTWLPSKNYWFVARTTSAGGINTYFGVEDASQKTHTYTYDINGTQTDNGSVDNGDLFGYFASVPGTAQTFNFKNGQASQFTVYGDKCLGNPTTPAQGQKSGLVMWEPVLGTSFSAGSLIGQDHIASEINFATSIVARRNSSGAVDVAFPITAGGFTNGADGLARLTYACQIDYISFK